MRLLCAPDMTKPALADEFYKREDADDGTDRRFAWCGGAWRPESFGPQIGSHERFDFRAQRRVAAAGLIEKCVLLLDRQVRDFVENVSCAIPPDVGHVYTADCEQVINRSIMTTLCQQSATFFANSR